MESYATYRLHIAYAVIKVSVQFYGNRYLEPNYFSDTLILAIASHG